MHNEAEETISLYKKLLDVMVKEQKDIEGRDLAAIEQNFAVKLEIMKQLDALNIRESGVLSAEQRARIETLIKKIIDLNQANADAVSTLKSEMRGSIADVHKSKTAIKAYNSV